MNDELKNIAQVEHSKHRCFDNFIVKLLGVIAAYCLFPKKPCINLQRTIDTQLSLFRIRRTHVILVNSYPTYFEKLPPLINQINRERRNSKNYVLFLGETGVESNQSPCLSLIQFQIDDGSLVLSAFQRSSDANLGLPTDIYHLYLISRQIDFPLKSITLYLSNVHIYMNNIDFTKALLAGDETVRFSLNV